MNALVELEIGQAVALLIHVHHAIMELPDLPDFGIRGMLAGEASGEAFEIAEHDQAVLNVFRGEMPDHRTPSG